MSNVTLQLMDETLKFLQTKHPKAIIARTEALLLGPKKLIHSVVFDDIDEELVLKETIKTKGGCGPSGFDADN